MYWAPEWHRRHRGRLALLNRALRFANVCWAIIELAQLGTDHIGDLFLARVLDRGGTGRDVARIMLVVLTLWGTLSDPLTFPLPLAINVLCQAASLLLQVAFQAPVALHILRSPALQQPVEAMCVQLSSVLNAATFSMAASPAQPPCSHIARRCAVHGPVVVVVVLVWLTHWIAHVASLVIELVLKRHWVQQLQRTTPAAPDHQLAELEVLLQHLDMDWRHIVFWYLVAGPLLVWLVLTSVLDGNMDDWPGACVPPHRHMVA